MIVIVIDEIVVAPAEFVPVSEDMINEIGQLPAVGIGM